MNLVFDAPLHSLVLQEGLIGPFPDEGELGGWLLGEKFPKGFKLQNLSGMLYLLIASIKLSKKFVRKGKFHLEVTLQCKIGGLVKVSALMAP